MKKTLKVIAPLVPLLLLLLVYVGDKYSQSLVLALVFFGLLGLLIGAALLGDTLDRPMAGRVTRGYFAAGSTAWWIRAAAAVGGCLLGLVLSNAPYQGMIVFPHKSAGLWVAAGFSMAFLAFLLVWPPKPAWSLLVLLAAGLALRLAWFSQWEINPAKRDMLPLVISALERFLSFENPYGFHQMQVGSEVPLTYPPGLWLLHLPAHVLGLDIRWTAWLSDAVIVICLGGSALKARASTFGAVFVALTAYLFLPDVHWNGIYAEPHADWAVLAALAAAVLAERPLASGALLGIALTTRPFNLLLAPFLAIWLFRRFGFATARRALIITGAIAAAIYLPFVLADPDAFYSGTVRWLLDYGPAHRKWFVHKMSFSGFLYHKHLEAWLVRGQIASLALGTGLALWKLRSTRSLLAFWTAIYALFVGFNTIIWMSFWIGVCLLAVALAVAAGAAATRSDSVPPASREIAATGRKPWIIDAGLAVGIVAALAVMLFHLHRHFDESGLDRARAFVADEVRAGDLIIDNSGYRKAFLKAPYLLSKDDLPDGAALGEHLFHARLPRRRFVEPREPDRVIAVARYGLLGDKTDAYVQTGGPYRPVRTETFGHYFVGVDARVDGERPLLRMSAAPAGMTVTATSGSGASEGELRRNRWRFGRSAEGAAMSVQSCRFDKSATKMIRVTPRSKLTYTVTVTVPDGATWLTLFGGFPDRTAAWHKSEVTVVSKRNGGNILDTMVFPNRSGMRGRTLAINGKSPTLRFEITSGAPENRQFCLDALFSGVH